MYNSCLDLLEMVHKMINIGQFHSYYGDVDMIYFYNVLLSDFSNNMTSQMHLYLLNGK